eukprot:scaffold31696_cov139-Isochrysis_galbana.AAC.4
MILHRARSVWEEEVSNADIGTTAQCTQPHGTCTTEHSKRIHVSLPIISVPAHAQGGIRKRHKGKGAEGAGTGWGGEMGGTRCRGSSRVGPEICDMPLE